MTISIQKQNLFDGSTEYTMTENNIIDTKKYIEFVRETTSPASSDFAALVTRLTELEITHDADVSRLMTAAFGVSAEAGELAEIIKKIFLQGKPYNEENIIHMKNNPKAKSIAVIDGCSLLLWALPTTSLARFWPTLA